VKTLTLEEAAAFLKLHPMTVQGEGALGRDSSGNHNGYRL
jgi:hypothetical protein